MTIVKIPNLQNLCVESLNLDGLYEMFFHYKILLTAVTSVTILRFLDNLKA